MKISVIVPVYNVEKYIDQCLLSLTDQTFEDYEVFVVIDGSTDSSQKIAEKYEKSYPEKVKIIVQENRGLGGARNAGMKMAVGEYLLFVDSDDFLERNALSTLYHVAVSGGYDIVCCEIECVDEKGAVLWREGTGFNRIRKIPRTEKTNLLLKPCAWNKLIKTSLFREHDILFPDRLWFEDLATIPKLFLHTDSVCCIEDALYKYLQREGSIIHSRKVERNVEIIKAMDSVTDYCKTMGMYDAYYKELEFLTVYHVLLCASKRVNVVEPGSELQMEFYEYTKTRFKDYKASVYYKKLLTFREKMAILLLERKMYDLLHFLISH